MAACLLLAVAFVVFYIVQSAPPSQAGNGIAQIGLRYGRQHMTWISGPTVQSTHTFRLRQLPDNLARYTTPQIRQDVNVPALVKQYGSNRRVGLVVLSGEFNTLPPDEGVDVHGQVVVLVDIAARRGLYIND